jgi:clan AA aspartic protease
MLKMNKRKNEMGYIKTKIEIRNPKNPKLEKIEKEALVDTGALMLCIPEHVRLQMGFEELEKREVTTADGKKQLVPYVGPVLVRFENRSCFVGALVLGDDILLGVVPMEDMDLIVSPAHKKVLVNPDSPNFPQALVK